MEHARFRLASASVLALALAAPVVGTSGQDLAALQAADAPPNGIWIDSLDLSKAPIRRPRGQRGQTTPPSPLVIKLAGIVYPHGVPLQSDAT
jgi:hypothetical protein